MSGHPGGHGDADGLPWDVLLPAVGVALVAAGYLLLAARARRLNPRAGWSRWRTGWFLAGCGLLAAGLLPPVAPWAHGDFRGHMAQHLLIGMYAPLGLVLGAPVTLLLRNLPPEHGRRLTAVLRSRVAHVAAHPVVALLTGVGTLVALYFTPLYDTLSAGGAHGLLHAHFLLAGCLFAHAVAGPEPAPGRWSVPRRLVVLGVAIAAHALVSQALYGGWGTSVRAPVDEVRGGAELMYYGGDIAELLLAGALVATWRPRRTPAGVRPAGARGAQSTPESEAYTTTLSA
ncbi:cytochrome c oxidase assembly protein [Streptomyces sp. NPDC060194]|uniref:cytochrome c oxidase assembly protein n=1 Tax=Streptomyces sp. NPDC060194 TaxID=3347069 RepID=UPI003654822A